MTNQVIGGCLVALFDASKQIVEIGERIGHTNLRDEMTGEWTQSHHSLQGTMGEQGIGTGWVGPKCFG
jgi:hypothetical protein